MGHKLAKRDKLGIHREIETYTLSLLTLLIEASFQAKTLKGSTLRKARLRVEVLKHLIRTEYELKILSEKNYLFAASFLQEISKMVNGWIKYIQENP